MIRHENTLQLNLRRKLNTLLLVRRVVAREQIEQGGFVDGSFCMENGDDDGWLANGFT